MRKEAGTGAAFLNEVQSKPDLHPKLFKQTSNGVSPSKEDQSWRWNRKTEELHPEAGARRPNLCVGGSSEWKKSQSFPTISSDVCASVMEMQIKLSLRVMTEEITDAARRNRLLRVDDLIVYANLPKQGGNMKVALRFSPFTWLLKCKINTGHFQVWPNITAVIWYYTVILGEDMSLTHENKIEWNVQYAISNLLPQPIRSRGSEHAKKTKTKRFYSVRSSMWGCGGHGHMLRSFISPAATWCNQMVM